MINIKILAASSFGALLVLCVPFLLNFKKTKNRFISPSSPKRELTPIEISLLLFGFTLGTWWVVALLSGLINPKVFEVVLYGVFASTCISWSVFLVSLIFEASDYKHDPDRKLKKISRKVDFILWGYWVFSVVVFVGFLMETFKH